MEDKNRRCPICNEFNYQPLLETKGYLLVQCKNCGMWFINNIIRSDVLANVYDEKYFTRDVYSKYEYDSNYEASHSGKRDMAILEEIKRLIPIRRILDVGCGPGYFLRCAKRMGYECYGLDISRWATNHASRTEGLKIFDGQIEDAGFEDNYFGVVVMSHVLEHCENPLTLLKEAHRVLKRGGIAVIMIPTEVDSLVWRFGHVAGCINVPAHINYFSRSHLLKLSERIGFNMIVSRRTISFFYNYNYFIHRRKRQCDGKISSMEGYYKRNLEEDGIVNKVLSLLKKSISGCFEAIGFGDELILFLRK